MLQAVTRLVRQPDCLVFIAVQRPCIENSHYVNEDYMTAVLRAIGLHLTIVRRSAMLWLGVEIRTALPYVLIEGAKKGDGDEHKQEEAVYLSKKMVVRTSATRKIFSVLPHRVKRNSVQPTRQNFWRDEFNAGSLSFVEEAGGNMVMIADKGDDGRGLGGLCRQKR